MLPRSKLTSILFAATRSHAATRLRAAMLPRGYAATTLKLRKRQFQKIKSNLLRPKKSFNIGNNNDGMSKSSQVSIKVHKLFLNKYINPRRLATGEVPGSKPGKGENLFISD